MSGTTALKTFLATAFAIVILALAACGQPQLKGNAIGMDGDSFSRDSLTVKVGTSVTFENDGPATHFLATGQNGSYIAEATAPSQLEKPTGIEIDAGQTLHFVFTTPGTYHITCTIHPMMNTTVIVQASDMQG